MRFGKRSALAAIIALLLSTVTFTFQANASHTYLMLVSTGAGGAVPNCCAAEPSISGDGRLVAFSSDSTNLIAGGNSAGQVFVRDLVLGTTILVSVDSSGAAGNGLSETPFISRDGRWVVFLSSASNLVPGDTNGKKDVFARDLASGSIERISISSTGAQADGDSDYPVISDGPSYFAAFESAATNLVGGDTNGKSDIFLRALGTGSTTRVSVTSSGAQASGGNSAQPAISATGRYIAYASAATNLVLADTNTTSDVFLHDRTGGSTTRVSVGAGGVQAVGGPSFAPTISSDGRYISFESGASNLALGDTNGKDDIFLRDTTTSTTSRASVTATGLQLNGKSVMPSVSDDGSVAFQSDASNLPGVSGWDDVYLRTTSDTLLVSQNASGWAGDSVSGWPSISSNHRYVGFVSYSDLTGQGVDPTQVYRRDLGETTPPTIQSLTATLAAFSPNSDGVKDSTTITASLVDDTPPISWRLDLKDDSGSTIRTFSGAGDSVNQTWNGRNSGGAVVPDGNYTAVLTATDDWGNAAVRTLALAVDNTGPSVTSWLPGLEANTLWKRPVISAVLADSLSGIDPATPMLQIDGNTVPSSYQSSTSTVSGTPTTDLSVDNDHVPQVTLTDLAGNTASVTGAFRVIDVSQQALQASIPDVSTPVPPASQCPTTCSVTFRNVKVRVGAHDVAVSSSARPGSGTFSRTVSLSSAVVQWVGLTGQPFTTSPSLAAAHRDDQVTLDEAYGGRLVLPFIDADQPYQDVTVTVPINAAKGSTAILRMTPVTVAAPCADTSTAADPASCGGPTAPGIDPFPNPPIVGPDSISDAQMALDDVAPTIDLLPALPEDFDLGAPLPASGDISLTNYEPGKILLWVQSGQDIYSIVSDHGDAATAVTQANAGPFDDIDVANGVDRFYHLTVAVGAEKVKVAQYAEDLRLQYVQLIPNSGGLLASTNDQYANSTDQYNLFGSTGISMRNAWDYAIFTWSNGLRPSDSYRGSREVALGIIDTGIQGQHDDLFGKVMAGYNIGTDQSIPAGADSETGCSGGHGTEVAGVNALTNNGTGLAGVNWNSHLVPIVAFRNCSWMDRGALIRRAQLLGVEAINASYGFDDYYSLECENIKNAYDHGIITATAYAQGSQTGKYPGRCSYTITTSASGTNGRPPSWTYKDSYVDVLAPGEDISTTTFTTGPFHNVSYGLRSQGLGIDGTSFSAPTIAGLTELLWAMGVPPKQIGSALVYSAFPEIYYYPAAYPCGSKPCGRVHAFRALAAALANGVFEEWTSTYPQRWTRRQSCGSTTTVTSTTENTTVAGAKGMRTVCTGGGYVDVQQVHPIQPGWRYSFSVRAKSTTSSPSWMQVFICLYDANGAKVGSCSSVNGSTAGVGTSWSTIQRSIVASGAAVSARVILRTTSSSATNYWDDAVFYARCPTTYGSC